ncbi:MAG TPA: 1,2-phenylacetyl-CoA epoxidase subunit PaaB [Acidimicrobiia bacterium]|nr:1,2-phenylacetyl-CoA epoxidase subunit PaaB [Acidimicrobiia bacterium]
MTYDVPVAPGESADIDEGTELSAEPWPMWEVFVRAHRGLSHVHIGSLHAADAESALQNARDVYTRRGEGASLWVVLSSEIHSFDPDEISEYVEANEKVYRLATTYEIPDEVGRM